jgi:hypothetical protein
MFNKTKTLYKAQNYITLNTILQVNKHKIQYSRYSTILLLIGGTKFLRQMKKIFTSYSE